MVTRIKFLINYCAKIVEGQYDANYEGEHHNVILLPEGF